MTIHHEFRKGQSVMVFLRDGRVIRTKYLEKRSKKLVFECGPIAIKDIRATSIAKLASTEMAKDFADNPLTDNPIGAK